MKTKMKLRLENICKTEKLDNKSKRKSHSDSHQTSCDIYFKGPLAACLGLIGCCGCGRWAEDNCDCICSIICCIRFI